MIEDLKQDTDCRMRKSVANLQDDLKKIRAGRAHPGLIDHIVVPYYGNDVPLNQVANIVAEDTRTLAVTPWERQLTAVVEKAIRESDLGLNPTTAGQVIRIPLPPLTQQRRQELGRVVRQQGEECRVAIRNIRRDANNTLKELLKEKAISADESTSSEAQVQALTDKYIADVEKLVEAKEAELTEI